MIEKLATWDEYESDYTTFNVCGSEIRVHTYILTPCVRKNPFDFNISDVLKDDTKPKEILLPQQEESLLLFAKCDNTYQKICDEIIILLGTELRISELCGLTVMDLDFKEQ